MIVQTALHYLTPRECAARKGADLEELWEQTLQK